jgi:hypothetical protein
VNERKAILKSCSGDSTETALEQGGIGLRIGQIVYVISDPDSVVEVAEKQGQNAGWWVLERDLEYLPGADPPTESSKGE